MFDCSINLKNDININISLVHIIIMISVQSLLPEGTNLIEIYVTKKIKDSFAIDINLNDGFITKVMSLFNNWKTTEYTSFYKNDLVYIYESSNDNQYVYSKHKECDRIIQKNKHDLYFISYKYSKIPTHLFPCTNDIDDRISFIINECKLSNRLSLIIKKDPFATSVFIEYRHSPQVEIEKIEYRIKTILETISKIDISL